MRTLRLISLPSSLQKALVLAVLTLPVLATVYLHRFQAGVDELAVQAQQRLALLSASLDAELLRNESLPTVLAPHPVLQEVLTSAGAPDAVARANALLADVRTRTGTGVIYLIAPSGITLAASNWREPESFIGENYAFRPYFREALAGRTGMFFAVGATTRIPGFFIAQPVREGDKVIGVLAIKVELTTLENTWAESGEALLVVDHHGVVALSSRPHWKFTTLEPLSPQSRATLDATRQYYTAPLDTLPLKWRSAQRASLEGREYAVGSRNLRWSDWRMLMLMDTRPAATAAQAQALAVALALCLAAIGGLYWAQRARRLRERLAAQAALEETVATRTADLAATNARLRNEVAERAAAEDKLRNAQRALIEANRLGALGQMAAGVVHELNQPLAAMRGFAGNSLIFLERGQLAPLKENLQQIIELVERMARLTAQLKVFASRQQSAGGIAPAQRTLERIASWFEQRLQAAGIRLTLVIDVDSLPLDPQALEQVASNLVGNAMDALAGRPDGQIELRAHGDDTGRWLEVADNGPGIPAALREKITQPFFSTKPLGHGLGLGLAIVGDLVDASGGQLEIGASDSGGARIRATWPPADGQV
ncbi:hypothetical protein CJ010_12540 [Azoarcus sp. DD4]|uniref:sensor histidine kinase n=1 Tax=Azoarcus sp. DD4 TaxID=2027405 RepID=UPI0011271298|nr:ATP-binding protein [Azoarcus sp. DD4]QDF97298.1 hypothetical protein CJ010_12540 [Azoarcus sp. DD4]